MLSHLARIALIGLCAISVVVDARAESPETGQKLIGMYVHQHWPYKHPYAARTWTLDDWSGYVEALHRVGYNTIIVWPVLETMPVPPTPSDVANIEKIARVIDVVHGLGMRVYLTISPNVVPDSAAAGQATFQDRHFFHTDIRVNPGNAAAVELMMRQRESLFRPLAKADGVLIIDSDPGGYPKSTNAEFVNLLVEHRRMFDRLRPGIEVVYWMWAGWPAYARYYETGNFAWGKPEEFQEALTLLKERNPEPWGLAYGLEHAQKAGVAERVINLQYGAIEGEPSFPLTNFGNDVAWRAGGNLGPRGIIGNAQTHCVQLPNTFAFARGAQGQALAESDYVAFADDLIVGCGRAIVEAWAALASSDTARMRSAAGAIERLAGEKLEPGPLRGLLFGDARRFLIDLAIQLRYAAALHVFNAASASGAELTEPLTEYLVALENWYARHGYQNFWGAPEAALRKVGSAEINAMLDPPLGAKTPFGQVKESFYRKETFTPDLIRAIRRELGSRRATESRPAGAAKPFRMRGVYFHDGFAFEPKSWAPLHWDAEQWRRQIDWLQACGINTIEFATQFEFSRVPATEAEKRKVSDRQAIRAYAQSKGLKFGYILTNTVASTVPEGQEPGDQMLGRAVELCPRVAGNFEKTAAIQKWFMHAYRDADFFEEFAADWGGCRCGTCGIPEYLRYVRTFSDELARLNAAATLYANTWCISYWGPDPNPLGWKVVFDREITGSRQVIDMLPDLPRNVHVALPCHHLYRPLAYSSYGSLASTPVFPQEVDIRRIRAAGREVLAWPHFVMDDDPARPQAWGIVHCEVRYIRELLRRLSAVGIDKVMGNLYLPTLQLVNTYAYGRLLETPDADAGDILQDFARLVAHSEDAAKLTEVLCWIENGSFWGQQMPSDGRLRPLTCSLTKADALRMAGEIRANGNPALPLPVDAGAWLKQLPRSIERMEWVR